MGTDIFNTLFNSGIAFAQVGFMFGALICSLIGAAMIYANFHRNTGDYRVGARVTGLRSQDKDGGTLYYPVYEYTAKDGMVVQAESDWGASHLTSKMIGTKAYIVVNPATPKRAKTSLPIFIFFGSVFLLFGAGLMYSAFTQYPANGYTWIMLVAGTLYLAFKIKGLIKPRDQWETKEEFRTGKVAEFLERREDMPILDRRGLEDHERKRNVAARRTAPIAFIVALGLLAGGYYFGKDIYLMTSMGTPVTGGLVRYVPNHDSDGGTTYSPVVRYTSADQNVHSFTDRFSSSARPYVENGPVPVLYLENTEKAMIDRGIWNWALPGGLALFGLLCLMGALSSWAKTTRI